MSAKGQSKYRKTERGELMKKFIDKIKTIKIKEAWERLPKTAKVFVYVFASYTLKTISVNIGLIEDSALADYLVGAINLVIVFIEESVPAVKARLAK